MGMSIKPILFNTDMVRAILDGRKTVTRRVVKPHNPVKASRMGGYHQENGLWIDTDINNGDSEGHIKDYSVSSTWWTIGGYIKKFSPYQRGDIVYVRETWQCINPYSDKEYVYKASCDADFSSDIGKWLPSIHMPKEAARIWLKVTNVRMERLQDISIRQIENEGVETEEPLCLNGEEIIYAFSQLWDSTIKKADIERYGWKGNPWVWVIEFERFEKPQETKYADNDTGRCGLMSVT